MDDAYREEVVMAIHGSGVEFELPQFLLAGMSYRESTFRTDIKGPASEPELGLMQVGVYCRRIARCSPYCGNLETVEQQIDCGSCCLRWGVDRCGSLKGGLISYVSKGGKCRLEDTNKPRKVWNAVKRRYRLWSKMREIVGRTDSLSPPVS